VRPSIAIVALMMASVGSFAGAQSVPVESIGLQKARSDALKTKGWKPAYTKTFDLSGLPDYHPTRRFHGTIRQWGSNYLADSPLEGYFEKAFRKYQPGVRFENNLSSTFIGMAGLYTKKANLAAMGRRATWDELQTYQRVFGTLPVEIVMATGSYDVSGWTFALVPFVNKDNPIRNLTVDQLDGIFGAERDGGWKGNNWDPSVARGPEKNIRTWGQLGLTGDWANKPIHVYGYNLNFHFPRDFADKVFGGGYKWNESMREYSNRLYPAGKRGDFGKLWNAGDQMMDAVAGDKYGITYTSMQYRKKPNVKTVPLARTASGPYVYPTLETVQDRSYPLTREVYFYTNRPAGGKVDPLIAEYLRFVVSRQGQELVQKDGKYLPLTPELARKQIEEIEKLGTVSHSIDGG